MTSYQQTPGNGPLDLAVEGPVARFVLNGENADNSLTDALIAALLTRFEDIRTNPDVRVLVIEHTGPWFCSGMDLRGNHEPTQEQPFFDILDFLTTVDMITMAVVNGRASGGGVGLAAACDVVIASEQARFSLPEALWGLLPANIYPVLLGRMGPARTRELTLTSREFGANEAVTNGLVDLVGDPLRQTVGRIEARCACIDRQAVSRIKNYAARFETTPLNSAREPAAQALAEALSAPGVREGIERWAATSKLPWE